MQLPFHLLLCSLTAVRGKTTGAKGTGFVKSSGFFLL